MNFPSEMGLFQKPECPDSGQNPIQFLENRILYFRNPSLKSKACDRIRVPDCLWPKRILENVFFSINTRGYDEVQNPVLPTLKGKVSSPLNAGETPPTPGLVLGCEVGVHKKSPKHIHPTTVASTAKHQSHRRLPPRAANQKGNHSWIM